MLAQRDRNCRVRSSLGMVHDLTGVPLLHDDAAVHEDHLVRHIPGKGHLVGDDDHGGVVCSASCADDLQHLAGKLRVQGGGGLVEAQDVRLHAPGPGQWPPAAAGRRRAGGDSAPPGLPGPSGPAGLPPSRSRMVLLGDLARSSRLGQQLPGQGHILQRRVLGEQVEVLKHQPEVQPLPPDLAPGRRPGSASSRVSSPHGQCRRCPGVSKKFRHRSRRGLAAAGGADDGQRLSLLQREADVPAAPGCRRRLSPGAVTSKIAMAPPPLPEIARACAPDHRNSSVSSPTNSQIDIPLCRTGAR